MCLILLAWRAHPEYSLIFAGNRDEAYERPSAPADFWSDDPRIYGGRDLQKGGTWLGLTRSGRVAAVTNYRERPAIKNMPRSRGELASAYLRGSQDPRRYLQSVSRAGSEYGPYSLLVGDGERLYYHSNRGEGILELPPGVHGLSNHLLNTPWPKITNGKARVAKLLGAAPAELTAGLFEILLDRTPAPEAELPNTGVGLQRERELSASFIAGDHYGTRASTVLLIDRSNGVLFIERAFGPGGKEGQTVRREFRLDAEVCSNSR
jgi:uncharacterized protein with NRDE domain